MYTLETRSEPRPVRSCHQILGVARDASPDELAAAYLRIAMPVHPEAFAGELEPLQARDRLRFREAAEAWAVLSDGMAIRRAGFDPDAQALAVFDETLAWRALGLARTGLDADAILRALAGEGCPQTVAWPAAQIAARLAALGVRPRPIVRRPQAAAVATSASLTPDGAGGPSDADADADADVEATLEQRVAAAVVDLGLLFVLCVAPVLMLGRSFEWPNVQVDRLAFLALLTGGFVYYVQAEVGWGATPGKRLFGLVVARIDGSPLDRRCVLVRHGLRTLSHCLFGLGFVTAGLMVPRRAVHDLLTGTCVRCAGGGRQEWVRGLCALPVVLAIGAMALALMGG